MQDDVAAGSDDDDDDDDDHGGHGDEGGQGGAEEANHFFKEIQVHGETHCMSTHAAAGFGSTNTSTSTSSLGHREQVLARLGQISRVLAGAKAGVEQLQVWGGTNT
jgi:hypothetical protein